MLHAVHDGVDLQVSRFAPYEIVDRAVVREIAASIQHAIIVVMRAGLWLASDREHELDIG
jgi:hypothetical protein